MTQPQFNFSGLTPDSIWQAMAEIGIRAESGLLALNSYENRVYQFTDEEKQRYVVKFYRPQRWSKAQILEEHQFCLALQQNNIPVIAPVVIEGQSVHQYQGYLFALYPSVGGRNFEVDNDDQLDSVGHYLGQIHQIGQASQFQHRRTLCDFTTMDSPIETISQCDLIPSSLRGRLIQAMERLLTELTPALSQPFTVRRLHGDCHPSNILWRDGPLFVDFDDITNGPAIQDIWMLLNGEQNDKRMQLDILLESYQNFCHFDVNELKLIEPLRGLRMLNYMAWIAKRWQDPAFPKAFPWFQQEPYWQNQINALEEQTSTILQPPLTLFSQW